VAVKKIVIYEGSIGKINSGSKAWKLPGGKKAKRSN
jgi:hypothetical protein